MEAISNGDATPPPSEPTLYDRRVTDQRPKHLCPRLSILKRSIILTTYLHTLHKFIRKIYASVLEYELKQNLCYV